MTIVVVAGTLACSTAGSMNEYTAPECGASFTYPTSWSIDSEGGDIIILRHGPWVGDVADESILILCGEGTFQDGAERVGFDRAGAAWSVNLGTGAFEATSLPDGLEGWAMGRCYDGENRVYATCDEYARYRWIDGRWIGASGTLDDVIRNLVVGAILEKPQRDSGAAAGTNPPNGTILARP